MNLRPLRALRDLDRRLDEMHAQDRAAEELARFELARSATSFSSRTKKVVDSTVSLSATMMRAGEVREAQRLMREAEMEVRTEEAALIETVNEVKAQGEIRKKRMSRLRMAKAMATTMLSASMFVTSAFGVVLARSVIEDDPTVSEDAGRNDRIAKTLLTRKNGAQQIELLPGVAVKMTKAELKRFEILTGQGDQDALREFLERKLPSGLVAEVEAVLLSLSTAAANKTDEVVQALPDVVQEVKEDAGSTSSSKGQKSEDAKAEESQPSPPADQEPIEEEPEPSPEPQPSPSPSDKDKDGGESPAPLPDDWPV